MLPCVSLLGLEQMWIRLPVTLRTNCCLMRISQSVIGVLLGKDVIGRMRVFMLRGCGAMILRMRLALRAAQFLLMLSLGPDVLRLLVIRDLLQLRLILLNLLLEQHFVRLNLVQLLLHVVQVMGVLLRTASHGVARGAATPAPLDRGASRLMVVTAPCLVCSLRRLDHGGQASRRVHMILLSYGLVRLLVLEERIFIDRGVLVRFD